MNVLIRADASQTLGSGHVMRCATLADALRSRGAKVEFLCKPAPGDLCAWLAEKGYAVKRLSPTYDSYEDEINAIRSLLGICEYDWLVVDHYDIDIQWESTMRSWARSIFVIDDLGRPHDCDLLLDQNLLESDDPYRHCTPHHCRRLLGPRYALLRPEFATTRTNLPIRNGVVDHIFVNFGGSDPTGEIPQIINVLKEIEWKNKTTIVLGPANPHRKQLIAEYGNSPTLFLLEKSTEMAQLMTEANLAIGAGGSTIWERCCLGLPSIVIPIAQNQLETTTALARRGIIAAIIGSESTKHLRLKQAILTLIKRRSQCIAMANAGMALVDGRGTTRVVNAFISRRNENVES